MAEAAPVGSLSNALPSSWSEQEGVETFVVFRISAFQASCACCEASHQDFALLGSHTSSGVGQEYGAFDMERNRPDSGSFSVMDACSRHVAVPTL